MEDKMGRLSDDIKNSFAIALKDKAAVRAGVNKKKKRVIQEDPIKKRLILVVNYVRALGNKGNRILLYPDNESEFPEGVCDALNFFIDEGLKLEELMKKSAKIEEPNLNFMGKMRRYKGATRDIHIRKMESRGKNPSYDCAIKCSPVRANSIRQVFVHFFNGENKKIVVNQHQVSETWAKTMLLWFRIATLQFYIYQAAKEGTSLGTEALMHGLKTAYVHMADIFCGSRGDLNEWWFKSFFF